MSRIQNLVQTIVNQSASDLHLGEERIPMMRLDGQLIPLSTEDILTRSDMTAILEEMIGKEKSAFFMAEQEIDFSYNHDEDTRLRGNAFFQRDKISVALRLIPPVRTFEELNLPSQIQEFCHKQQGFFLVVGPVGQGKSTTLASMISYINANRTEHIVTVEDPIEYLFKNNQSIIDQREIGLDTEDFEVALKSIFRQDVDVIMVGEMRSPETISTAVTAAETGHLVFSTLHTNTASQTIDRIVDSFPGEQQGQIRAQLSNSLLGIFSQRLIPRITGGLIPAYELLVNTTAVSNLIRENRTHEIDMLIETGTEQGMIHMNRSLVDLVRRGEITMENALQFSNDPQSLKRLV
jgi:twitching motility protein PilT